MTKNNTFFSVKACKKSLKIPKS